MSLMSWLAEFLRPCVHTWRIVAKMQDDPDRPIEIRIVRECEICGALDEHVYRGPALRCPPHKWVTDTRANVFGDDDAKRPHHVRLEQHCSACGEVRAIDLDPDNFETTNGHDKATANGNGGDKQIA